MSDKLPGVYALVLAAGKGTRMRSDRAKVLHELAGAPMIAYVLDSVAALPLAATVVVVGHQRQEVAVAVADRGVRIAVQEQQLGTGHAALAAVGQLPAADATILILCGDTPLIRPATLRAMLAAHRRSGDVLTVLTTRLADPAGYGRIVSDREGRLTAIVEERDADPAQKRITEINAGIYCVEASFLWPALARITNDNQQGELYLTDIVGIATRDGQRVGRWLCPDSGEVLGVNSPEDLAQAQAILRQRRAGGKP